MTSRIGTEGTVARARAVAERGPIATLPKTTHDVVRGLDSGVRLLVLLNRNRHRGGPPAPASGQRPAQTRAVGFLSGTSHPDRPHRSGRGAHSSSRPSTGDQDASTGRVKRSFRDTSVARGAAQDAIVVRLAIVMRLPGSCCIVRKCSFLGTSTRRLGSPRRRPRLGHLVYTGAGRAAAAGTGSVPIA